jgi:phosphate uptake regulator
MEFRKLISFGKTSYVLSIPKSWIQKNNLHKGSLVSMDEKEGNLVLMPHTENRKTERKTEIDLSNLNPIISRILHALYKVGYDEVKLKYEERGTLETIHQMLHDEMIGFEIIEQKPGYARIKTVAGGIETEFDNILRRTFLLLKSMLEGILEAVEKEDLTTIKSLRLMERNNNKYTGFCRRIMNRGEFKDSSKITYMYCLIEELEKLADQGKYFCDHLRSKNNIKTIEKEVKEVYKDVVEMYTRLYELHYKYDITKAAELFKRRKELIKKSLELSGKDPKKALALSYLVSMAQQIANMLSFELEMRL